MHISFQVIAGAVESQPAIKWNCFTDKERETHTDTQQQQHTPRSPIKPVLAAVTHNLGLVYLNGSATAGRSLAVAVKYRTCSHEYFASVESWLWNLSDVK